MSYQWAVISVFIGHCSTTITVNYSFIPFHDPPNISEVSSNYTPEPHLYNSTPHDVTAFAGLRSLAEGSITKGSQARTPTVVCAPHLRSYSTHSRRGRNLALSASPPFGDPSASARKGVRRCPPQKSPSPSASSHLPETSPSSLGEQAN